MKHRLCTGPLTCLLFLALAGAPLAAAEATPTPRQEAYWWMDEIREAAFALSRARTGAVAQWPRMQVSPGAAALPLPAAEGKITLDGTLDEPGWARATAFPVGPIFGPWRTGPFLLTVRAMRIGTQTYVALESPVDLAGLSALADASLLLKVGALGVRMDADGKVPGGAALRKADGCVIELAAPTGKGGLDLTVYPEAVLRIAGKLPAGFSELGISRLGGGGRRNRPGGTLWLAPYAVRLVPSTTAVQIGVRVGDDGGVTLSRRVTTANAKPHAAETALQRFPGSGVFPYEWHAAAGGGGFKATGFVYVEPVGMTGKTSGTRPRSRRQRRGAYCAARAARAAAMLARLDAPLLFVKRHPYYAGHIYDDYYCYHPGGGIYVKDNPDQPGKAVVRPIIDPTTKPTLGEGVYRDPEVHWDGQKVLFCHKGSAGGHTSIYEIDLPTRTLRRLTDPQRDIDDGILCASASAFAGHHDITPAYLGDDRIVFTSTRPRNLVPCFNSTVDTLHIMNPDGTGIRPLSVNNVNEFDPSPLPDGRILHGRWEYVDKTALYMQSLWTTNPDGTSETSLFANNLARPTAVLDARPVPGTRMVVASLTPHNGQAVGAIAMIDAECDKNDLQAVFDFTPEYPVRMDQGLRDGPCDPWPLDKDHVLIANNAVGGHGIIELVDRQGRRELVHADAEISCYAPMLLKPRPRPAVLPDHTTPAQRGRFAVMDVYQGLGGIERGRVKFLRVIEETARSSGLPPGGRWWNQAFLVSWQGGYTVKNFLGVVPVEADGSAYFQAPPGRALYFQALDADGRMVESMRTFVQAAPGVTRSCIGCHEYKQGAPNKPSRPIALRKPPAEIRPESWGSGYLDYASQIQPILDRNCLSCHGGEKGIDAGVDLSGGWTWAFNISYETLLKNTLTGFLNCNNGSVHTSILQPPGKIGSGSAPLAALLISGHGKRIPKLTRPERDAILAWMDGNSCYYGTWNYTPHATCKAILDTGGQLTGAMRQAGCATCHRGPVGNDWINLRRPERSRILRAPLAKGPEGLGLAWCRNRPAPAGLGLVTQRNQPPDVYRPSALRKPDPAGAPRVTFASPRDARYQNMLAIIRRGRDAALARARVDMPGAQIIPGQCRQLLHPPLPPQVPELSASLDADGQAVLRWPGSGTMIGLTFEIHAGPSATFTPTDQTKIGETPWFAFTDPLPEPGERHYAMVMVSGARRSAPARASITVPKAAAPNPPTGLTAEPGPGEISLRWSAPGAGQFTYVVYRARGAAYQRLTAKPIDVPQFVDAPLPAKTPQRYVVRAVARRGGLSEASEPVTAAALPFVKEPMFVFDPAAGLTGSVYGGGKVRGTLHGPAKLAGGVLDTSAGGYMTLPKHAHFNVRKALTVECWLRIDKDAQMPVVLACGAWQGAGWFLQRYQGRWRWYVGGIACDGGRPAMGKWTHVACTYNGQKAEVFLDGRRAASAAGTADTTPWNGPLVIGQYSTPNETFQVFGRIGPVRIYRRALSAREAAEHFKAGPPKQ